MYDFCDLTDTVNNFENAVISTGCCPFFQSKIKSSLKERNEMTSIAQQVSCLPYYLCTNWTPKWHSSLSEWRTQKGIEATATEHTGKHARTSKVEIYLHTCSQKLKASENRLKQLCASMQAAVRWNKEKIKSCLIARQIILSSDEILLYDIIFWLKCAVVCWIKFLG